MLAGGGSMLATHLYIIKHVAGSVAAESAAAKPQMRNVVTLSLAVQRMAGSS